MNRTELEDSWREEERRAFSGWDFSHIKARWQHESEDWDYEALIQQNLAPTDCLLDMGTGGGEFLLALDHPYDKTSVTEAWEPNIRLCQERLSPLGITVYPAQEPARLPIEDNAFDIVINRHAAYDYGEILRILKPGGLFITQQVGSENCRELVRLLNGGAQEGSVEFSLATELALCKERGFDVLYADECFPKVRFFDAGAIVFWAKAIVWSFPGFSVEKRRDTLFSLHERILRDGFVSDAQHRFVIIARNRK